MTNITTLQRLILVKESYDELKSLIRSSERKGCSFMVECTELTPNPSYDLFINKDTKPKHLERRVLINRSHIIDFAEPFKPIYDAAENS